MEAGSPSSSPSPSGAQRSIMHQSVKTRPSEKDRPQAAVLTQRHKEHEVAAGGRRQRRVLQRLERPRDAVAVLGRQQPLEGGPHADRAHDRAAGHHRRPAPQPNHHAGRRPRRVHHQRLDRCVDQHRAAARLWPQSDAQFLSAFATTFLSRNSALGRTDRRDDPARQLRSAAGWVGSAVKVVVGDHAVDGPRRAVGGQAVIALAADGRGSAPWPERAVGATLTRRKQREGSAVRRTHW